MPNHTGDEYGKLPAKLPTLELVRGLLADQAEIEATRLTGHLPGSEAIGLSLVSTGIAAHLSDSNFEGLYTRTTAWEGCDLSNCRFSRSRWNDSRLSGCRMTGANFSESVVDGLLIADCRIDLGNFRFAKLSNVTFRHCVLVELDLSNAVLDNVSFTACDLTGASFGHASMSDVDLRGADLANLIGIGGLAGATISYNQALEMSAALAAHLGLNVEDAV